MPDYFHLTPEALTMRFYSKSQVKNSNLCDIADDNLPNNLFALKGDQLEIKESDNTLNKDLALALGFNQIFDQTTANQVGKLLIANGPTLDPKTILYYVRRLKNGPYGYGVAQHIKANFEQAKTAGNSSVPFQQNLGGGSNIDNDFVSFLQKKLGAADCFLTPADYFDFQGIYGTLTNTQNIWNYTTASASDTNNTQQRGNEGYETANKMPKPMQMVNGMLNLATLGTYKKFLKLFKTEKELAEEAASLKSGVSVREQNGGQSATPDIATARSRQEASTDGISEIAEFLGDAFRVFTFQYRANPYGYTNSAASPGNNAMIPQPPGIAGPPTKIPRSISNENLNLPQNGPQQTANIASNPLLPSLPSSPVTVVPFSKDPTIDPRIVFREDSPTYQDFISGKSKYVGIIAHSNVGTSEENVTIEGFEYNRAPIPLKIVGYSDNPNDTSRVKVLVEPKTQPFESVTGALTSDESNNSAQNCTANPSANVLSNGAVIPPGQNSANGVTLNNAEIAALRADYKRQIEEDKPPGIKERLAILTQAEVGNKPAPVQVAFIETVMNRGIATGQTDLNKIITDPRYYQVYKDGGYERARAELNSNRSILPRLVSNIETVYNGSNLSNMATDASIRYTEKDKKTGEIRVIEAPGKQFAITKILTFDGKDIQNPNQQYFLKNQTTPDGDEIFYQKGGYRNNGALIPFTNYR